MGRVGGFAVRYRDDIVPERTWVWSDPHFGHRNINDFANRPPDYESLMLERVAVNVGDGDTLLCLGDLCYSNNAAFRALVAPYITGDRRLLIPGNHDHARPSFYKKCGFKLARPFALPVSPLGESDLYVPHVSKDVRGGIIEPQSKWIVSFSHYPWDAEEEGMPMPENHLRIHGHIHTAGYTRGAYVPFLKNHVNVSVEQTNYQPVRLDHLLRGVLLGIYPEGEDPMADEPESKNPHIDTEAAAERFKIAQDTHRPR